MRNFSKSYGVTRPQEIAAKVARFRVLAPVVAPLALIPDVALSDDEMLFPAIELEAPPEIDPTPDTTTPAPLEAVEALGAEWDKELEARVEMRHYLDEMKGERALLGRQLKEAESVCNPAINGVYDNPDTSKIRARLVELDERLIFEDEATRPGGEITFRGSAVCNGTGIFGRIESDTTGTFTALRAGRQYRNAAILPFWGPLPTGEMRKACDGHRKQAACAILETVLAADPVTAPTAFETAQNHFRQFAATFLNELPVEATFTGEDVWAWLEVQQ